jgi:hypothetical protein
MGKQNKGYTPHPPNSSSPARMNPFGRGQEDAKDAPAKKLVGQEGKIKLWPQINTDKRQIK